MLASARSAPAQHDDLLSRPSAAADLLRPSAGEASPRGRTSDTLCRTTAPGARTPLLASSSAPLAPPCDGSMGRKPPHQAGLGRRGFRATTSFRPERLPSDRPGPRSPGGHDHVCFYTRTVLPRTRSPAAIRSRPVKGGVVASGYLPPLWPGLATNPGLAMRKMRLTDFCNRLTTRAPCGGIDSRAPLLRALRPFGRSTPAGGQSHLRYLEWSFA